MILLNRFTRLLEAEPAAGGGGAPILQGGGGGAPTLPPVVDMRGHLADDGSFKPGWSKAVGVPDTLEAKFTRPEAIARSYVQLEGSFGKKRIALPDATSTPQERDEYFKAIGRPDKPEDYGFKRPEKIGDKAVPDGAWDEGRAATWAKKLHEFGVPKDTANKILETAIGESMTGLDMIKSAQAQSQEQAITALKTEWKTDFDKNLALAKAAATQFGGEELIKHPGLGNDPVMIKALAKIGAAMTESPGVNPRASGGAQGGLTASQAKTKGLELSQTIAEKAAKNGQNWLNSPEARRLQEEKTALFKQAFAES